MVYNKRALYLQSGKNLNWEKDEGYNVNTLNSIEFLYMSNEQVEFEMKNNTIYISTQNLKYLGINLTKYVQDLYEENCRTLMNEIKELNRKMFHVHE